jgi:hypothetical protein
MATNIAIIMGLTGLIYGRMGWIGGLIRSPIPVIPPAAGGPILGPAVQTASKLAKVVKVAGLVTTGVEATAVLLGEGERRAEYRRQTGGDEKALHEQLDTANKFLKDHPEGFWNSLVYGERIFDEQKRKEKVEYQLHAMHQPAAAAEATNIPAYALGAWRIHSDQLAVIHKDEMIVPQPYADELRSNVEVTQHRPMDDDSLDASDNEPNLPNEQSDSQLAHLHHLPKLTTLLQSIESVLQEIRNNGELLNGPGIGGNGSVGYGV